MPKARAPREMPAPLELECLKALWRLGQGNVREVREALLPGRNLAYTTVMTVLDRLARKGGVERRKVGRSFLYAPLVSRDALRRAAVRGLVDSFFEGSEAELVSFLRGRRPVTNGAGQPASESSLDPSLL